MVVMRTIQLNRIKRKSAKFRNGIGLPVLSIGGSIAFM